MKTFFEKNETKQCKCGDEKPSQAIFCFNCGNYWGSMVSEKSLTFKNSNGSVEWMNAMMNDFYPEDEDPKEGG